MKNETQAAKLGIEETRAFTSANSELTRRAFMKRAGMAAGLAGVATLSSTSALGAESWPVRSHNLVKDGDVMLFKVSV